MPSQYIDFPFAGGVDEKTQSELVEPGSVLVATNLRQLKNGSLQKRLGNSLVGNATVTGGTMTTGRRLLSYKNELLQTDNLSLYSRSSTAAAYRKASGMAPQLSITNQPAMALQFNVGKYDAMSLNGYMAMCATIPATPGANPVWNGFCSIVDLATGAMVSPPTLVFAVTANSHSPPFAMVTVGTRIVIVYAEYSGGATELHYSWIDVASAATINAGWTIVLGAIANDTNSVRRLDACSLGGTQFAIAYVNSNVGSLAQTVTVRTFNSSFAQLAVGTIAASPVGFVAPAAVGISGNSSDVIFVAWGSNGGTDVKVVGLDPTTLAVSATASIVATTDTTTATAIGIQRTGTGTGWLVCSDSGSANHGTYSRSFQVSAGAITSVDDVWLRTNRAVMDSRPFSANGRMYVTMRPVDRVTGAAGGDLFLVDLTQSMADKTPGATRGYTRTVGHIAPRLCYAPTGMDAGSSPTVGRNTTGTNVVQVSSTQVLIPSSVVKNTTSSSLDTVTLDWGATNVAQPSILGENLAMGGSPPSFYDGERSSEIGFFQRPEKVAFGSFSGAGITGTFKYVAVYEQVDNRGNWHISNISDPSADVVAANQGVIMSATTLQFTNRGDAQSAAARSGTNAIRIVLYRTQDGGTVFYRVVAPSVQCILINDPDTYTQSFPVDTLPDASLGAPLYSQPGIPNVALVRVTPPCLYPMIVHGDRLVGANGNTVWFSGQTVYGEGYWFADNFQFPVETGGDITALASLDGSLVVFKRDRIAFVDGSGPPDNGAGGDFSPPQFIAADVGCIEPRSVCVTPAGVMFQSLRGIEMLSRGRSLATYFGSRVEDTLATYPVITSAVLDEARGTVTFTCQPELSNSGVEIIWDYVHNIWVHDIRSRLASPGVGIDSAIMWGNQAGTVPIRTCLSAYGDVYQETPTAYFDSDTVWVATDLVSPWIKMGGLQGYGRTNGFALLFQQRTPCDILISVRVDYRSTVVQTRLFTAAEIAAEIAAGRNPIELWVTMKVQKCTAFQVEIQDATPTGGPAAGTGQGPVLIGLRIEYQQKQDRNRGIVLG